MHFVNLDLNPGSSSGHLHFGASFIHIVAFIHEYMVERFRKKDNALEPCLCACVFVLLSR